MACNDNKPLPGQLAPPPPYDHPLGPIGGKKPDSEYQRWLEKERRDFVEKHRASQAQESPFYKSLLVPQTGEIRVVDPNSGGEKGSKLARFDLIPPEFEWALAEAYGVGALKYADRNWEKGYKWSLSVAALRRHLNAFMAGEWFDPESHGGKTPHIISVAWHAVALFIFRTRGLGTNDIHVNLSKEGQRIG